MNLLDQAIIVARSKDRAMNPFRKEAEPVEEMVTIQQKARALDLLVEMRARAHPTAYNEFRVIRDLIVNGMTITAEGQDRNLVTAISKCYIKYQEALKMGAK